MTVKINRTLLLVLGVSLGCDVPAIESTEPQAASSSVPEEINSADAAPPPAISPSAVTSTSQTVRTKPKPELLVTQEIASMSLDWVCRPKFHSAYGDTVAGTCFLVEVEHNLPPVVLTANSLLGPAGGLHFDLDHSAQGNRLSQLELLDCETNESLAIYPATPLITIGRKEWAGTPIIGDIAAFQFPGAKAITAGRLAKKPVKKNDRVWLLARDMGTLSDSVKPHPAKVTWAGKNEPIVGDHLTSAYNVIGYSFDNKHLSTRGLTGAPVVNDRGEVVAIHLNAERAKTGLLKGTGNPTYRYREGLVHALKTEQEGFEVSYHGYTIRLPAGYSIASDNTSDSVWMTSDLQLGRCMIRLRLMPNPGKYDLSLGQRMNLLRTGFRSIARGSSYSSSANGDPLLLPGLAAIKGGFAVSPGVMADPFGTDVAYSGILLIGVNPDHILIAKFVAKGASKGSSAWLLGERALGTLARPGKPLPEVPFEESSHVNQVFIHVTGVRASQYKAVLRGLVRSISVNEYESMSVNAVEEGVKMSLKTKLSAQAIADRIRLQVTPQVNAWTKMVLIDLSNTEQLESVANEGSEEKDPLLKQLRKLEAKSWLADPEGAIQYLQKTDPSSVSSGEVRRRVATALAEMLLRDPANAMQRHELIPALALWDRDVARESLRELITKSNSIYKFFTRNEAFKALAEVAEVSDIELAATELMQDISGHTSEHAVTILSQFPKEAEPVVLEKLRNGLCASNLHEVRTIEALASFGGRPTAKAFRKMAKKDNPRATQNALREGLATLGARLKSK